ncbi:unnamed protein product [Penicillium bialowiezense]
MWEDPEVSKCINHPRIRSDSFGSEHIEDPFTILAKSALEEHDWMSDACHGISTHDDLLVRSMHTMAPSDVISSFSTRTDGSDASSDHTQYLSVHDHEPQAMTSISPGQDINVTVSAASAALFRAQSPSGTIGKIIAKGTKAHDHSQTRRQKQKWVLSNVNWSQT